MEKVREELAKEGLGEERHLLSEKIQ